MLTAKRVPLMYIQLCGFGLHKIMRGGWGWKIEIFYHICKTMKYLFSIFQLRIYKFFIHILMACVCDIRSLVPDLHSWGGGNVGHWGPMRMRSTLG